MKSNFKRIVKSYKKAQKEYNKDFISDDGRVFKINGDKFNKTISVGCSYLLNEGIYTVTVKYYGERICCPIGIISKGDASYIFKRTFHTIFK